LETKVSPERIGKEMDLMFEGRYPFLAMKLLYDFGIIKLILKFPPTCQGKNRIFKTFYRASRLK
jgi:tRNA nucleotidyltransferase/poly(A) polymerase